MISSITEKGNLKISIDSVEWYELVDYLSEVDNPESDSVMYEVFEELVCNGFMWVDEMCLTEAPILQSFADDSLYYYNDYCLRSPVADLVEHQQVIFTLLRQVTQV